MRGGSLRGRATELEVRRTLGPNNIGPVQRFAARAGTGPDQAMEIITVQDYL